MPRKKTTTAEALSLVQAPTVLDAVESQPAVYVHPRLATKTFYAFAVVKEPSSGDGWTGARLYKFKVKLEDAVNATHSDLQDIQLERAITQMTDAIIEQEVG